jgi:hypothetical protein
MTMTPAGASVTISIVQAPACHLCQDAEAVVAQLSTEYALHCRLVDLHSDEGLALVAAHRPAMNPLVLLDGGFFSAGRLPRGKLRRALARSCDPAGWAER